MTATKLSLQRKDHVWIVSDEKLSGVGVSTGPGDRFYAVVTAMTKTRVWVKCGTTGFGQRSYCFTDAGLPARDTEQLIGKCHLDLHLCENCREPIKLGCCGCDDEAAADGVK